MNSFVVFAQIVKVSDTHYKKLNMTPMVTMVIRFPNPRKDRPPVDLSVIAYGELARQVRKECRIGDCLIFEGRLKMETIDRPEGFKEKIAQLVLSRVINPKPFRLAHGNTANLSGKMVAKSNHQTDRQDTSTPKAYFAETVAENNNQTVHQYASNTLDDSKEHLPNGDYSVETESAETANSPKQPWMENPVDPSKLPF